jgi:hypothetical protein
MGIKIDIETEYGVTAKHYEITNYNYNFYNGGC